MLCPVAPQASVELLPGSLGLTPCLLVPGHSSRPSGPSRLPSSYLTPPCASASPTLQTAVGASGTCEAELTEGTGLHVQFWKLLGQAIEELSSVAAWAQHMPDGPFAATP